MSEGTDKGWLGKTIASSKPEHLIAAVEPLHAVVWTDLDEVGNTAFYECVRLLATQINSGDHQPPMPRRGRFSIADRYNVYEVVFEHKKPTTANSMLKQVTPAVAGMQRKYWLKATLVLSRLSAPVTVAASETDVVRAEATATDTAPAEADAVAAVAVSPDSAKSPAIQKRIRKRVAGEGKRNLLAEISEGVDQIVSGEVVPVTRVVEVSAEAHARLMTAGVAVREQDIVPAGKTRAFRRNTRARNGSERNRERILRALIEQSHTCDELEQMLLLPHQTASACMRWLNQRGYIAVSGHSRVTRAGGWANVYGIPAGRGRVEGTHYVFDGKPITDIDGVVQLTELGDVIRYPMIRVPVTQQTTEKLWYRAELNGGTDADPEIRVETRMLWRGAVVDVYNCNVRLEGATRAETDHVIGFGASVSAGGHITGAEPRETLTELLDDCLDFISETQAANKKPEFPILECVVTAHAPNRPLANPQRVCFVLGGAPHSSNMDANADGIATALKLPHRSNGDAWEGEHPGVFAEEITELAHPAPDSGWYRLHDVDGVVQGLTSWYGNNHLIAEAHNGIYFGPIAFIGDADDSLEVAVRFLTGPV